MESQHVARSSLERDMEAASGKKRTPQHERRHQEKARKLPTHIVQAYLLGPGGHEGVGRKNKRCASIFATLQLEQECQLIFLCVPVPVERPKRWNGNLIQFWNPFWGPYLDPKLGSIFGSKNGVSHRKISLLPAHVVQADLRSCSLNMNVNL